MIDPSQIHESFLLGADAVLLIMSILSDSQAEELHSIASSLGMSVLIETHDANEVERSLLLPSPLIGVNNRNLKIMQTDLGTTEELAALIPDDKILISESGIHDPDDISRLRKSGAHSFLIGESLMKSGNVTENVQIFRKTI
jgi:indole-3-glycerol phosphate synthase